MPGRLGAPDAVTPRPRRRRKATGSPRQEAGDQQPAPRPASAQLPRPAPPRARPSPRRAPRRPHQPARPQALPGAEAAARGRRAELVGGSGSLGGHRLSTRPRRLSASFLPGRRAGLRDRPLPPPGRLRAASWPRLRLQPSEPPLPGSARRVPGVPGGLEGGDCPEVPPGAWRRPGPESLWGRGRVPGPSGLPRAVAAPAAWREAEDRSGAASRGSEGPPPSPAPRGLWFSRRAVCTRREEAGFEPLAEV